MGMTDAKTPIIIGVSLSEPHINGMAMRELYYIVDVRYVVIVQRPRVMFYTASLRVKNMRGIEHACAISVSTMCMEPFAESAAQTLISQLAHPKEPAETAEKQEKTERKIKDRAEHVHV